MGNSNFPLFGEFFATVESTKHFIEVCIFFSTQIKTFPVGKLSWVNFHKYEKQGLFLISPKNH